MMVRLNVTIVTGAPTEGVLNGLGIGTHTVYVSLDQVNYANDNLVGGSIDTTLNQNLTAGDASGNVTYNSIKLVDHKVNL